MISCCLRLLKAERSGENPAHNMPVAAARESDCLSQLVGSAPQQVGRASGAEEVTEARLTNHTGAS